RLVEVLGLDQAVAGDDVLGLRVGTVAQRALAVADHCAAGGHERLADVDEVAALLELAEPGAPALHPLLHLLRRGGRHRRPAVEINEFAHVGLLCCGLTGKTGERAAGGHQSFRKTSGDPEIERYEGRRTRNSAMSNVLVTGSSSGLGHAMVLALAARG